MDSLSTDREQVLIRPDRMTRLVYAAGGRLGIAATAPVVLGAGALLVIGGLHGDAGAIPFGCFLLGYFVLVWLWRFWDSRTFVLTIDQAGIEDRFGRHVRRWTWDQAALLAWDTGYRRSKTRTSFAPSVAVCAFGDPRPAATFGGLARNRNEVVEMLRKLDSAGWPVDERPWSASQWWDLDKRALAVPRHRSAHPPMNESGQ